VEVAVGVISSGVEVSNGLGSVIACGVISSFDPGVEVDTFVVLLQAVNNKENKMNKDLNLDVLFAVLINNYPDMISKGTGIKIRMKMIKVNTASHFRFESKGVI